MPEFPWSLTHVRFAWRVQGSVPLGGRPALWVVPGSLAPYCTQQLPHYYFYFPRLPAGAGGGGGGASGSGGALAGELRAAFPAAAASRGRLLAAAADQPTHLRVRGFQDQNGDSSHPYQWVQVASCRCYGTTAPAAPAAGLHCSTTDSLAPS